VSNLMPGLSDVDTEPADITHESRICDTCGFENEVQIVTWVDRAGLHEQWSCHLGHAHDETLEQGDDEPDRDGDGF